MKEIGFLSFGHWSASSYSQVRSSSDALLQSRPTAGPARLRYLDAVIGVLSAAGFSMPLAIRAIMSLDSYTYGFTLQESAWPFDPENVPEVAATFTRGLSSDEYPNLLAMAEMVTTAPGGGEVDFEFGLDLILDGLERLRNTAGH